MYKSFIKKNSISAAIIIFLILFIIFIYMKPNFIFTKKGGIRHFGLGKTDCTVFPIWLLVIIISIISYVSVIYYLF
jgi:hypothetical protein